MDAVSSDYTSIALIVDRSGSMQSIAEDTKGGVQQFISAQKQAQGKASFTLVQFDHEYEVLHRFSDLSQIDENAFAQQYHPRGTTALLDAVGRTVLEMSNSIEKMEPSTKPARVIIAVVTDGQENSSSEFTAAKVKNLIEEKQALGWDFVFLSADLNGIQDAKAYGFSSESVVYFDSSRIGAALKSAGERVSDARDGKKISGFSEEERAELSKPETPQSFSSKVSNYTRRFLPFQA